MTLVFDVSSQVAFYINKQKLNKMRNRKFWETNRNPITMLKYCDATERQFIANKNKTPLELLDLDEEPLSSIDLAPSLEWI